MEFAFTPEQAMIDETAKAFFAEHATSERTRKAMANDGIDHDLWRAFCQELGLGGVGIAEEDGGSGLGMVEFAILAEAAGAHVAAMPMLGSLAMAAQAISVGASKEQKEKWLRPLIQGEVIGAVIGSNALEVNDNHLTGNCDFVPHGGSAHVFVVGNADGTWVVDAKTQGIRVQTLTTMDQTRPYARVSLANVAAEPFADGVAGLAAAQATAWICVAAEALGGAQACLDRTVTYSRDRVQFGRPIGSFQAYKHRLADMMTEVEQARSAVYWAACAVDEDSEDAALAVHSAKAFAADTFAMCAANMIQLHGGIGITWEHDAHLYFKRARAIQSMLGTGEWHREQVAQLIGLGEAA